MKHLSVQDLSKAFDFISPNRLAAKLEYYGIKGNIFDLLTSYLCEKRQGTAWKSTMSPVIDIKYGVAQRPILGSTLFNLYINDLPTYISSAEICLYSDDTSLIVRVATLESLKTALEANAWFTANKLKMNKGKIQHLLFTTKILTLTQTLGAWNCR
ncbi:hypothetical protein Trydic_g23205 [Trypoxylus dichotomus]